VKVVPMRSSLVALIEPPIVWTRRCVMTKPSPVPPWRRVRVALTLPL